VKILSRLENQTVCAWKNGGGETTQLAIYPEKSKFEDEEFYWRVSRAKIQKSGPFSEFKRFYRGLIQLSGDPVRLGGQRLKLFEPFLFSGEKAIHCELSGTEATDINVLVNRAWGEFKLSSYQLEKGKKLSRYADFVCYYCHEGEMDANGTKIGSGELIALERETAIHALTDLTVVVIELRTSGGNAALI
jgi:environmental stress-induced protein Ves